MHTVRRLIVEKPVALEAEEVRKLSALATEFGAMILVGYHLAVHPLVQRLKDALEQDALGSLTHGRFRMYVPRGRTAGRWLSDDSQSGGPFVELMTHGFHLLQYLVTDLHLECSAIETASARSQAANAFCRAAQGGVFTLEVSSLFDGLGDATAVEIYGTRGSALLRRYGSPRRSELEIRTDADGFSSWKGEMSGDAGFEQLCQLALEDPSAGRRHRPVALETAIEPLEHAIKARALALGGIQ
jgi:predicted dehydrogenase